MQTTEEGEHRFLREGNHTKLARSGLAYGKRFQVDVMDAQARGEVPKFLGDGLLAVFELSRFGSETKAAQAALRAANEAMAGVETLNADAQVLPDIALWRPLHSGIALHKGRVFFGNVGAARRLGFTVIGSAVKATARIEALTKQLQSQILISEDVRALLDGTFRDLGTFELRGLSEPISRFAPMRSQRSSGRRPRSARPAAA